MFMNFEGIVQSFIVLLCTRTRRRLVGGSVTNNSKRQTH